MKKKLKDNHKTNIKPRFQLYLLLVILVIGLVCLGIFLYKKYGEMELIAPEEGARILIDEYNFEQLEKAKAILDNIPTDLGKFHTIKEFNDKYSSDIKPIKNCYYIRSNNGEYPYIFGFLLESEKYIQKFGTGYYAYPSYNLPVYENCTGVGNTGRCWDRNYSIYTYTISNPCEE